SRQIIASAEINSGISRKKFFSFCYIITNQTEIFNMNVRICYQNSNRRSISIFILKDYVCRGRSRTDNFATIINHSARDAIRNLWKNFHFSAIAV
ncbi:hypothetical protein CWN72_31655, partial [Klebsiella pneumoniae]